MVTVRRFYSELFNRNDQQEFLLVQTDKEEEGGFFRLFPAGFLL
jgi:hypothetical protein